MFIRAENRSCRDAFGKTKEMMRIFEDLTGIEFPFNKYDQTIVRKFRCSAEWKILRRPLFRTGTFFWRNFRSIEKSLFEDIVSHETRAFVVRQSRNLPKLGGTLAQRRFCDIYGSRLSRENVRSAKNTCKDPSKMRGNILSKMRSTPKRHGLYNLLARPDDSIFDTTILSKRRRGHPHSARNHRRQSFLESSKYLSQSP